MTDSTPPVGLARPLDVSEIVSFEVELVKRLSDLIRGMHTGAAIEAGEVAPRSDRWDVWARPDRTTSHRVVLIDGQRGTGKTTLMLTLLEAWRARPAGAPAEWDQAFGDIHQRVQPMPQLDFDPLPPHMPLLGWIVQAFKPLVDALEPAATVPFLEAPEEEAGDGTLLQAYWELFSAAVAGWGDGDLAGSATRDAEEWVLDRNFQSTRWHGLTATWRRFMEGLFTGLDADATFTGVSAEHRFPKGGLLVLPIDDADLQVARNRDLLLALRMLRHPRLVYLLTGHAEHLEEIAVTDYYGKQRAIVGESVGIAELDQLTEHSFAFWPRRMGRALVDKVIPRAHRFAMRHLGMKDLVHLAKQPGWEPLKAHFQALDLNHRASRILATVTDTMETDSVTETNSLWEWVDQMTRDTKTLAGFRPVEHLRGTRPGDGPRILLRGLDRFYERAVDHMETVGPIRVRLRARPCAVRGVAERIPHPTLPLVSASLFDWTSEEVDADGSGGAGAGSVVFQGEIQNSTVEVSTATETPRGSERDELDVADATLLLDWGFAVEDLEVHGISLEVSSPLATPVEVDGRRVEIPWPWIAPASPALAELALRRWHEGSVSGPAGAVSRWLWVQLLSAGGELDVSGASDLGAVVGAARDLFASIEESDPERAAALHDLFGRDAWMFTDRVFGLSESERNYLEAELAAFDDFGLADARQAQDEALDDVAVAAGAAAARVAEALGEAAADARERALESHLRAAATAAGVEAGLLLAQAGPGGQDAPLALSGEPARIEAAEEHPALWWIRAHGLEEWLEPHERLFGLGDGAMSEGADDSWATRAVGRLLARDPLDSAFGNRLLTGTDEGRKDWAEPARHQTHTLETFWLALLDSAKRVRPETFLPNTYRSRVRGSDDGLKLDLPSSFVAEPASRAADKAIFEGRVHELRVWDDWDVVGLYPKDDIIKAALHAALLVSDGVAGARPVVRRSKSQPWAGSRMRHALLRVDGRPLPVPPLDRWGDFELLGRIWARVVDRLVDDDPFGTPIDPVDGYLWLTTGLMDGVSFLESSVRAELDDLGRRFEGRRSIRAWAPRSDDATLWRRGVMEALGMPGD